MKNFIFFSIKIIAVFFTCYSNLFAQSKLEIKFQPDESVYVYETKGSGTPVDLYSAVIQNIAIINHSNEDIVIDGVEILATRDGKELQRYTVQDTILKQSAKKFKTYQEKGILQYYDFQFQTSRYLKDITFSESTTLSNEQAIVVTHRTMLFQTLPDLVTVVVNAHDPIGKSIIGKGSLKVINHESKNEYHFPLKGTWQALGAPSLISHHRWGSIQEFAYDLVKIGSDGTTHIGDGTRLNDYYAFGEPVYSIGDGKVISTSSEATESSKNLKQANETSEEYTERSVADQGKLLAKGFSYVMGNHVIIQHDNGEYSYYLHLKQGSLKVKPGDIVKRGQHIASLGHTGNSTEPHLHFHVTDGPDMAYSRSIPVSFKNISLYQDESPNIRHIHYGQLIITKD